MIPILCSEYVNRLGGKIIFLCYEDDIFVAALPNHFLLATLSILSLNIFNIFIKEAFKRKPRKYIGLLPLPPFARIGNFRFFPRLFSQGGVVIIGKKILFTFYMFWSM